MLTSVFSAGNRLTGAQLMALVDAINRKLLVGKGDTTSSANVTTEAVVSTAPSAIFANGRVYSVLVTGGCQDVAGSARGQFRLRKGTTTAGTLWCDFGDVSSAGNTNMSLAMLIANNTGSDISSQCCLTMTANAGTVHHVGQTAQPRGFWVYDVGDFSDFNGFAPISLIT